MARALALAVFLAAAAAPALAESVSDLRAEVSRVQSRQKALQARRAVLQSELDEVAGRIERRKAAERKPGRLFADRELEGLLRRSQALSDELTALLGAERKEAEALAAGQGRLIAELDAQITALRDRWAAAGRAERVALVPQIKSLRAERDALRGALPAGPAAPAPGVGAASSDDPEDLRQEADALYDSEDKLRREEKALAARIEELKAERDLERRMGEFLREGALFDEGDRRISTHPRASAVGLSSAEAASPAPTTISNAPGTRDAPTSASVPAGGAPAPGSSELGPAGSRGGAVLEPSPQAGGAVGRQDPPVSIAPAGELPRGGLQAEPDRRAGSVAPYSEDESPEELTARRVKLRAMADDARKRADEAARRARDLR